MRERNVQASQASLAIQRSKTLGVSKLSDTDFVRLRNWLDTPVRELRKNTADRGANRVPNCFLYLPDQEHSARQQPAERGLRRCLTAVG